MKNERLEAAAKDLDRLCDLMYEDLDEVIGRSRVMPLPDVRKVICFVLWHKDYMQKEIAWVMNYADHSTVSTNIKKVHEQKKLYQEATELIALL
jgi:chromosomal replication initiation ATPase DnaA